VDAAVVARRVTDHARDRGAIPVLADCASWAARWAAGRPLAGRPVTATFQHEGADHRYLRHPYHYTWLNERAVEVPLAAAVLAEHPGARVLEVGNVLSHHLPVGHPVIDEYEQAPGVHNVDVVDVATDPQVSRPVDLVLSISTLEHVGFDEPVRDPDKPARAVAALTSLLAPGGRLWCTIPVGYNPALEEQVLAGELGFDRVTALRRTGRDNRWQQVPVGDVAGVRYDWLLYSAHAVFVAEPTR
jgi:hypothetical protein